MAASDITFLTFHQQTTLACEAVDAFLQAAKRRNPQAEMVVPLLHNVIRRTVRFFIFIFIFSLIFEMWRCTKDFI